MSEGRDRFAWSIASSIMALMANCHKDKGKALTPDDFNPTLSKEDRMRNAILITDENVEIMRGEFKRLEAGGIRLEAIQDIDEHS
jgi:hypothetical protein